MRLRTHTYELRSGHGCTATLSCIGTLLSHEGVKYTQAAWELTSTKTPLALLSFQAKGYTRKNWFGVNPFAYRTGITVSCTGSRDVTTVKVFVDQTRAVLYSVYWTLLAILASSPLPRHVGLPVGIAITIIAWFGHVSFLSGGLLRAELLHELRRMDAVRGSA